MIISRRLQAFTSSFLASLIGTSLVVGGVSLFKSKPALAQTAPIAGQEVASAAVQPLAVFRTREVSLKIVQGQTAWGQRDLQRLLGATWQFYPNGVFVFTAPDLRTDLYPIKGIYQVSGDTITFAATSVANSTVAHNFAQVRGQISHYNSKPTLQMTWANGSTMAAVVDNILFGPAQSSSYYEVEATLGL